MSAKNKYSDLEKGVIYARYSSSGQRDESIEGQLRDCHKYAEFFGINIVGEYCDRAMTGTSDKRPEFQRMISDSAKGQFTVVITWKNDRFARSRYDSAIYKAKLKKNGVRVLYAKESIPEGPEGIVLEGVMESFAEYYSANLSQNVKRGNYDSALKLQTLGQTVFGLRKGPDKRFELDPATAPVVKRIFEEYAGGRPAKDIYEDLNAEGFRTSRGNPFNKNSLRRILENEKYIGVYEYAGVRDEHGIPAIVSKELFEKVQKMVAYHHRSPAAKPTAGGFLLTGKLFCGECGKPMTGDGGTGQSGRVYSYYICNGRREHKCNKSRAQKEWIEDAVVSALASIVNSDEMINEFADRFMIWQSKEKTNDVLAGLEMELHQVEAAIKNNMELVDSGFVTDSIKSHLVDLESKKVSLETGIAKEKISNDSPKIERDAVVWFLERFRDTDQADTGWRIYIVDTFLKAAYLYDDGRLLLHLNFTGDKSKVSLKIAEQTVEAGEAICSSSAPSGAPKQKSCHNRDRIFVLYYSIFIFHYSLFINDRLLRRYAMNSSTTRVGTGLLVADVPDMVHFYRDILGLDAEWDGGNFAELRTANGELALFMYSRQEFCRAIGQEYQPPRGINRSFEIGLWLPSYEDVDAEYARLKALGVSLPCGEPVTYDFGIRNFYVADPEGNLLEIGSRR